MKFIEIAHKNFLKEYKDEFEDIILKLKHKSVKFDVDNKDCAIFMPGKRLAGSAGFTLEQFSDKGVKGELYAFCQKGIWVYLAKVAKDGSFFSHITTDELIDKFIKWKP